MEGSPRQLTPDIPASPRRCQPFHELQPRWCQQPPDSAAEEGETEFSSVNGVYQYTITEIFGDVRKSWQDQTTEGGMRGACGLLCELQQKSVMLAGARQIAVAEIDGPVELARAIHIAGFVHSDSDGGIPVGAAET